MQIPRSAINSFLIFICYFLVMKNQWYVVLTYRRIEIVAAEEKLSSDGSNHITGYGDSIVFHFGPNLYYLILSPHSLFARNLFKHLSETIHTLRILLAKLVVICQRDTS